MPLVFYLSDIRTIIPKLYLNMRIYTYQGLVSPPVRMLLLDCMYVGWKGEQQIIIIHQATSLWVFPCTLQKWIVYGKMVRAVIFLDERPTPLSKCCASSCNHITCPNTFVHHVYSRVKLQTVSTSISIYPSYMFLPQPASARLPPGNSLSSCQLPLYLQSRVWVQQTSDYNYKCAVM